MLALAYQADVALIMVPCDGNFTTAFARARQARDPRSNPPAFPVDQLVECQSNRHRLQQDCDIAGYKLARYEEVSNEMKSMLVKVGWKKDMVEKNVPSLDFSFWRYSRA